MSIDYFSYPWRDAEWHIIPRHMHEGVYEYVMNGRPTGRFLETLFAGLPISTWYARADAYNTRAMHAWMTFLHNYVPASCKGSFEAVRAWEQLGGLNGKAKTSDS